MSRMKYINFKNIGIVIFGGHVSHSDMAQLIGDKPVSAGFFNAGDTDYVSCYGESVSLKLTSDPADTEQLRRILS